MGGGHDERRGRVSSPVSGSAPLGEADAPPRADFLEPPVSQRPSSTQRDRPGCWTCPPCMSSGSCEAHSCPPPSGISGTKSSRGGRARGPTVPGPEQQLRAMAGGGGASSDLCPPPTALQQPGPSLLGSEPPSINTCTVWSPLPPPRRTFYQGLLLLSHFSRVRLCETP